MCLKSGSVTIIQENKLRTPNIPTAEVARGLKVLRKEDTRQQARRLGFKGTHLEAWRLFYRLWKLARLNFFAH